jgi:glutamate formiminotransferase/formiminotetrahydrofolate cyclodeaminase
MDDCVKISEIFGERAARELNIPIFLYEYAARSPQRKNLSDIRKGEYEGLAEKLKDPEWKPDFGDAVFNARSGAVVTGARKILIAYNINLNTINERHAQEIALRIREIGRPRKDEFGNALKNEKDEVIRIPGSLKAVKAIGVFLERYKISQVSINLVDYETTSMHMAYEEVKRQAHLLGIDVSGSELVGLAPLNALLQAGMFYAEGRELNEEQYISLAVRKLGLNRFEPFDPKKKIIEYMI